MEEGENVANSAWFTRESYCGYIRRRKRRANRLESRIIYRKGWSGWHVMWMHWPSSHVFPPILSCSFHSLPFTLKECVCDADTNDVRRDQTRTFDISNRIRSTNSFWPPSTPQCALSYRANLRPTHNANLCSVYRVFRVFPRKSLVRSFGYVFIRVGSLFCL